MERQRTDIDRIELWIRPSARTTAGPNRDLALERVRRLDQRDGTAVEVSVWDRTVDRTSLPDAPSALDRLERTLDAFAAWAERTGRSLDPFFRRRRLESTILDESREIQRLPTVALAEYSDNELVHVAPSREGSRVVDVLDRLEHLAKTAFDDATGTESADANLDDAVSGATESTDGPESTESVEDGRSRDTSFEAPQSGPNPSN